MKGDHHNEGNEYAGSSSGRFELDDAQQKIEKRIIK